MITFTRVLEVAWYGWAFALSYALLDLGASLWQRRQRR